jgi:hypothetical protein
MKHYQVKDISNGMQDMDVRSRNVKTVWAMCGNVDLDNDVIVPEAFSRTITARGPLGKNLIWSLVDHKQALDRVHRIGSEIHDSILIMDYVTEGTIEERVLQVLETKSDNFEQIVRDKDQLMKLLKDDKAGTL